MTQEWLETWSNSLCYNNSISLLAQPVFGSFYLYTSCGPLNEDKSRIYETAEVKKNQLIRRVSHILRHRGDISIDAYYFDDTTVDTNQSTRCGRIQRVDGSIYLIMLMRIYTLS